MVRSFQVTHTREGGADGERARGRERRLQRTGGELLGQTKLVSGVRAERVVSHQLLHHRPRESGLEAAPDVDAGKLVFFGRALRRQLRSLLREIGAFGVRLRADRDVFARGHRQRTGHEPCDARDQDFRAAGTGGGNANDEACGRHDPVVRAENRRAQPANPFSAMPFAMGHVNPLNRYLCTVTGSPVACSRI